MELNDYEEYLKKRHANEEHSFSEDDWQGMEVILNKHLPVKKDRRRFIFFFLIAVVIGIGSILFFTKLNNPITPGGSTAKKEHEKYLTKTTPANLIIKKDQITSSQPKVVLHEQLKLSNKIDTRIDTRQKDDLANDLIKSKSELDQTTQYKQEQYVNPTKNREAKNRINLNILPVEKTNQKVDLNRERKTGKRVEGQQMQSQKTDTFTGEKIEVENNTASVLEYASDKENQKKTDTTPMVANKTAITKSVQKNKINSNTKNKFSLLITTGGESTGTQNNSLGELTPFFGFGLQYNIGKRFGIRVGIQTGNKTYSAGDADYNPPVGNWAANVKLNSVDAVCKVYEIPVSFIFNAGQWKKTTINFSVGSSSFIMKQEAYVFKYRTRSGNDTTRQARFINNSEHYFSSINFSTFAEKHLNKKLSLVVEPYVKIPLSGIGFGRTKIYSIGLASTLRIKL